MTTVAVRVAACVSLAAGLFSFSLPLHAEPPRALDAGKLPDDARLQPLKDLEGYFPFTPPTSKAAWEKRAAEVRRQILISQGLFPMPTKTPLNAQIYGRVDRGEYTVEKAYFESAPGLFVTGNLYRPKNAKGKVPAVLFAHGHWKDARLSESTDAELLQEIATGQERFEEGGKSRFQSLCVQLARMGCVVWQWDMLSDSDAIQFNAQIVHGFRKQRAEMNTTENWGLYSPQAESHLQSIMGLQTLNAVRSLDFVLSLADVDPGRIAVTGASGGGTQTMLLSAIDPRIKLSFPAVMVSTAMQGGCTCENASLLRIGTGNIEFAGLFAPGPLGMTTANDWTKELSTKGFPELKELYKTLGAPNNVMIHRGEHFPHNYNAVSRVGFYNWVNKHFKLGFKEPVIEKDYQRLTRAELSVWDDQHPAPKAADPEFEKQLLKWLTQDAQQQLTVAAAQPDGLRAMHGQAFETILQRNYSAAGDVAWKQTHKTDRGAWLEMTGLIRNKTHGEEVPAVFCYPKKWNGRTVLWLTGAGKAGVFNNDGKLKPEFQRVVDSGTTLASIDLLGQGEFTADGKPVDKTQRVKNPREAAPYTFGYNNALFVSRVHDILTTVKFMKTHEQPSKQIAVAGVDGTGAIVAAARAQCGDVIDRAVVDTAGFRFGSVLDLHDVNFLPGGAKYGDVPALLALNAPGALMLAGETTESARMVRERYSAVRATEQLQINPGKVNTEAALKWLQE